MATREPSNPIQEEEMVADAKDVSPVGWDDVGTEIMAVSLIYVLAPFVLTYRAIRGLWNLL